jgi:mannosyl-oligosaccharide glucosidase
MNADILVNAIATKFRTTVAPYEQPSLPHPGYALTLPNEVYSGSNLFAIQKTFDGAFHFDILFDSGSVKEKLTSTSSR